ncbi:hypothetical protein F4821DRAFT_40197 [Hypoxylon rubiginosum]|uniref:Uncharacterized protein n=1 Tax=Hypoxylon rubiginosum TaxID=110542 RepID=A0ACC0CKM1_9PEZI|nr:hypothetical protein F4821DRAFT_40197 [Hypoxylon rubiginosum]
MNWPFQVRASRTLLITRAFICVTKGEAWKAMCIERPTATEGSQLELKLLCLFRPKRCHLGRTIGFQLATTLQHSRNFNARAA